MPRPVIVVPGYYGSRLADRLTGDVVWLTVGGLLQPSTTLRALRYDPDDPDAVGAVGILDEVPLILPFWDIKVYEGLLDFLLNDQKLPPERVLAFYYDWRRPMAHAADALADQIRRLLAETGSPKVDIIAHSFGGLVARACLQKHNLAGEVEWLITLGTPHKGMFKTFEAISSRGTDILTFSAAEVRDTARDFPSAYELLPNDPGDGLYSVNGNAGDPYVDTSWCQDQRMQTLLSDAQNAVQTLLPTTLPVKTCFVYGTRLETGTKARSDGAGNLTFDRTEDGDTTVSRVSASGQGLDGADTVLRFQVPLGVHSQLPNDELVQQKILTPILLDRPFPALTVFARFRSQPFFIPRSKNRLVVSVLDSSGNPVSNATVALTIVGTNIRNRQIPFDSARGDHTIDVTMPGPSVPNRQWKVEIQVPGQPKIVESGLLVRAA